jgi:hypothetical protein
MTALEDKLNSAMCGMFLMQLAAMCFIAFSAVTVMCSLRLGKIMIKTSNPASVN